MDTSELKDMKPMGKRENSPTSVYQRQVITKTLSGNAPTAGTETLGRSRANSDAIFTGSTIQEETLFETRIPKISNWLWNIDRPWEAFRSPNSPDFKIVRDKTENNTMTQAKRKDTTPPPPIKQTMERH
ncbi:hypothetical protein FSHL1_011970 [Fusarium sambucinum]